MKYLQLRNVSGIVIIFFLAINIAAQTVDTNTTYITYHNIDKAWKLTKGNGVKIAILDWLFDATPKASQKYADAISLVPNQPLGEHPPWHGEWMAEIVHTIAPEAKIIPVRCRPNSDVDHPETVVYKPYEKYLIEGIKYAADHGAVAVTSSMGLLKQSKELNDAVEYAAKKGTIFIDVHPEFLTYKDSTLIFCDSTQLNPLILHPGIVSVPDHPNTKRPGIHRDFYTWPYSINPVWKDGWGYSNAPPIVAGIIALMKSVNPGLGVKEVKNILIKTSVDRNGFNVIDANAAVELSQTLGK